MGGKTKEQTFETLQELHPILIQMLDQNQLIDQLNHALMTQSPVSPELIQPLHFVSTWTKMHCQLLQFYNKGGYLSMMEFLAQQQTYADAMMRILVLGIPMSGQTPPVASIMMNKAAFLGP